MDWSSIVAGALAGLAAGVVGSLVAPWVQLAVENRRETRAHRRQLLDQWRAMVGRQLRGEGQVIEDVAYVSLRGHLQPEVLKWLEQSGNSIRITDGTQGISADAGLADVSDEIDRLEREWGLA